MATGELVFGPFRISVSEQVLWRGPERLKITPKSLAVLQHLVQRAGTVVSKAELYDAVWTDTHVEAGSLKTCVAKIRRVLGDTADASRFIEAVPGRGYRFIAPVGISNLPVSLTSFVGRSAERAGVKRLLGEGRLVTVWGPAGVGKTRLAIEVARDLLSEMPHGVWWIDFSPISEPDLIAPTVAAILGVRGSPTAETLTKALRERRLLIIFDNCEHLTNQCAYLALSLLRACPDLKIFVTSREPLGIVGESVWPLAPLSVPELPTPDDEPSRDGDPGASDAVRLFVERAKDADPFFAISRENAGAVARICRCLDGLPLAIELAAARVRSVAAEQMAARLDDLLTFLVQRSRTDPARHQTLRAAFDWSYDLLSPKERELFASLSVFSGTFTLAAVESVCGGTVSCDDAELLEAISQLVDRALVIAEPSPGESRYRLLSTVRQYGREKLSPDLHAILARRHAEFFLRLVEQMEPSFHGAASGACLVRLRREQDNLRAVMQWSRECEDGGEIGLRLAVALWSWTRRGQLREGRSWVEAALERSAGAPVGLRAEALCGAGVLALIYGDLDQAYVRLDASVSLWRTTGAGEGLGRAMHYLGAVTQRLGNIGEATSLLEESVDILRHSGSRWDLAISLCALGTIKRDYQGQAAEAAQLYQESAAILRVLGDAWTLRYPLGELAALAARQRQYGLAEAYCRQTLIGLRPLEETWFLSTSIAALAAVRFGRDDHAHAARLFGAVEGLRQAATLAPHREIGVPEYESCLNELRAELGNARFEKLWAEGRKLSPDETITLALMLTEPAPEVMKV